MTTEDCAGFCTTGSAPSLVSATLTNYGRQILLRFDAAVYATSYLPRCGGGCAAGLECRVRAFCPLPLCHPPTNPSPPLPCSAIFAASTAAKLGAHTSVSSSSDTAELSVWLDYAANISVGAPVALLTKPAVVAWLDGRVVSGATAVALQVGACGCGSLVGTAAAALC